MRSATVTLLPGDGYRLPATDVSRSVTILDSLRLVMDHGYGHVHHALP